MALIYCLLCRYQRCNYWLAASIAKYVEAGKPSVLSVYSYRLKTNISSDIDLNTFLKARLETGLSAKLFLGSAQRRTIVTRQA